MHRVKTPFCKKCNHCYQLPDTHRSFRVPILLNCGHDMCKLCLKHFFKIKDPIICDVCEARTMIKDESQLHNLPIHYYLIGKLWCLNSFKKHELNDNISKLGMKKTPSTCLELNANNCYKCGNKANGFCQDCNIIFCRNCFTEVHIENETYSHHELIVIDNTNSTFLQQYVCKTHLKRIDYICIPCKLQVCSDCASKDHHYQTTDLIHKVVSFDTFNSYQLPRLNELTTKGHSLLQNLLSSKDALHKDMSSYQYSLNKKNGDLINIKQQVANFITSVSGSLQNTEHTLINLLNEAEQSVLDSMINVLNKLNEFVTDFQEKIINVEQFMKHNQNSCEIILDSIFTIEKLLNSTLRVAKKNKIEPVITCNSGVFDAIQQCVNLKIGNYYSDTYILTDLFKIPPGYTCISSNDFATQQHERPTSSISSNSTESSNLSSCFVDLAISKPLHKPQIGYQLIKEIKQSNVEGIIVTHVNSPSDFYLQLVDNSAVMQMINSEMKKFVEAKAQKFGCIEMNNVIYAVHTSDNKWYRGIVINMNMQPSETLYTLLYIDFGSTESVTADRIYRLPESIIPIPPLAYNCTLYSLKPSALTGWSKHAISDFNHLMLEKKGAYFVYPINTHCEPKEVDIVWANDVNPLSTRDAMLYMNHGSSDVPTNVELRENFLKTITMPKPEKLQKGANYDIQATHFISPSEFYFRIRDEVNDNRFKNMMSKLQSKYKPTEVDTHRSYLLYSPQIGMAVAARYSLDQCWYRAKITSLPEPRMVTVFYVDYGNSETLPWDQLRVLDLGLLQMKPLAIKACLAEIKPAVKGEETTKWTEEAFKAFIDLLVDFNNVINTTVYVLSIDGDDDDEDNDNTHQVVVYNRWSREEFCINRLLLNQGHASALNLKSCIFNKPNNRQLLNNASMKTNLRSNETTLLSSEDFLAFTNQRPVYVSENHTWSPTNKKNKNFPGIEMKVHRVNSPDDIVLKYTDLDIGSLTERMNKIYKADKKKLIKTDWKAKDLCAMFINKYGNWYRGKILDIHTTTKTASVLLYDLDEIHLEVSLNVLYNLDPKVVHDKCCFLHCSLFNLIPLGASGGTWANFVGDRLTEILAKYPNVYFSKIERNGDQAVGEIWVKDNVKPLPLEIAQDRWININRLMIEQGFAMSDKRYKQVIEQSDSPSELELDESFDHTKHKDCWLPPSPLDPDTNLFKVIPLYVDMQCNVYFRTADDDTEQLLQEVSENLNHEFCNSKPEPLNFKWTLGQMVIVQYHLDKMWYRGTIIEVKVNNKFEVQFLDYGNIETCSHNDLRSTLYMTDIRQLCVKGFLSSIGPLTKNKKWTEPDLDCLHTLIVEKPCTVVIDFQKSTDNNYAITRMRNTAIKNPLESDICQCMVTLNKAYFLYMDAFKLDSLSMTPEVDIPEVDNSLNLNNYKNTISMENYEDFSVSNSATAMLKTGHSGYHDYTNYSEYSEVEDYDTENSMGSATNIEEECLEDQENCLQPIQIEEINYDISARQCSKQSISSEETEYQDCDHNENMKCITNIEISNNKKEQTINYGSRAEYVCIDDLDHKNNASRAALIQKLNNDLINYDEQIIENVALDNIESNKSSETPLKITHIDALTLTLSDKTSTALSTTRVKINSEVDTHQIMCSVPSSNNLKDTKSEHNEKRILPIAKRMKKIHSVPEDLKITNIMNTSVSYSKMSLKYNDAIEACLCEVKAPTRMMLVIEKIGGVDMSDRKMEMNNQLMNFMKRACIPELDEIIPGTPVVVEHNYLWKRGTIVDGGQSVFLVDSGISIKLIKKNLRQCPIEFIEQPIFSIDCQLAHVTKNLNVSSEDVMNKLTEVLNGVYLRVVGVNELDSDVVGVELFNNKKDIAYQLMIDSGMLIHK